MNFHFVAVCVAIDSTKVRTNRTCAKAFRTNSRNEFVYHILVTHLNKDNGR